MQYDLTTKIKDGDRNLYGIWPFYFFSIGLFHNPSVPLFSQKGQIRWYFYFKLKEMSKNRTVHREELDWDNERNDFVEMLESVSANSEDGCRILRVSFFQILKWQ